MILLKVHVNCYYMFSINPHSLLQKYCLRHHFLHSVLVFFSSLPAHHVLLLQPTVVL